MTTAARRKPMAKTPARSQPRATRAKANDALADLAAEISKSKALDWLVHNVTFVDPSGATLDSDTVVGHSAADHDHDHQHDHDGADS